MRKPLRKLTATLALALALAGCGANSANQATPETKPKAPAAPAAPAAPSIDPRELTGITAVQSLPEPTPPPQKPAQQLPAKITDAAGVQHVITNTDRVLALDLTGSLSRTVITLGLGENLVGRTVSSTEKSLEKLPVVTAAGHSLNAEAILSLKPTLILHDGSLGPSEVIKQLTASGIPLVKMPETKSASAAPALIEATANALGVPAEGKKLAASTRAGIENAVEENKKLAGTHPPLKVAFLYVRGSGGVFFILGKDDGATSLIEGAGAVDTAAAANIAGLTPANAETLAAINPEAIILMEEGLKSSGGLEGFLTRPGVKETTAGKKQRIITIPDGQSLSFGPQSAENLTLLAKALYLGK